MSLVDEPLILAIETATRAGSVSIARGGAILGSLSGNPTASYSTDLLDHIRQLLNDVRVSLNEIDFFAVAIGPGSFTGLRIGLATTKAFGVYLDRQCVAVSSLAAVAHSAGYSKRTIALLPAGRGEVYAQMFRVDPAGETEALDDAAHLSSQVLLERYGSLPSLRWAGDGAHLHEDQLRNWAMNQEIEFVKFSNSGALPAKLQSGWTLAHIDPHLAESVAILGLFDYRAGKTLSASDLHANYVRPSDAEMNEKWRKQNLLPASR